MFLIFNLSNTPSILSTLDDAAISSLDVLFATDHGKGHSCHQSTSMLCSSLIVILDRWLIDLDALSFNNISNTMLESGEVGGRQGIGFRDDRNQIDTCAETLHDFDVERLQGMASGTDEIEAGVDTEIDLVMSLGLLLLQHIGLVLVVEELNDWHP